MVKGGEGKSTKPTICRISGSLCCLRGSSQQVFAQRVKRLEEEILCWFMTTRQPTIPPICG